MIDPETDRPVSSGGTRESTPPARRAAPRWALLVALAVLSLTAALSLRSLRPPQPVPASAADTVFSAERAWRHVEAIAIAPHPAGSAAHERVRDYVVRELAAAGLEPRVETASQRVRYGRAAGSNVVLHNIVAVLAGTEPTGAVALVCHYDSHRRAPGAGDDGLAVSALLDVARMLRTGPPLRNDIVFLFTDGEELGLLGALAFVEADPAASRVRVALNFEGRGSHGPVLMFETGPGNAALVRTFHRADPRPIASSLFPEAYRYLPNDTDFTVFLRTGTRGLNFAHIDRAETYHHTSDTPANASPATLQHHGDHALAMARAFGNLDLRALPGPESGNAVYFNVPGFGLARYPASLALPHAIVVLLLWAAAVVLGRRRNVVRGRGVTVGMLLSIVIVVACIAAAWAVGRIAGMEAEAGSLTNKLVVDEVPYMLVLVAIAIALVLGLIAACARRLGAPALALGCALIPAVLGTVAAIVTPGASYLLLWPALFALVAAHVAARAAPLLGRDALLITALLVPAAALWAPHVSLFLTGLTLSMAPALGAIAALAALSIAPVAVLARRAS